jgi:hypothetical protein
MVKTTLVLTTVQGALRQIKRLVVPLPCHLINTNLHLLLIIKHVNDQARLIPPLIHATERPTV